MNATKKKKSVWSLSGIALLMLAMLHLQMPVEVQAAETEQVIVIEDEAEAGETIEVTDESQTGAIVEVTDETIEETKSDAAAELAEATGKVENILLIGTDQRDDSWNGNSDVMIVASINSETEQIVLTSFMRDLYADIPGYGVHKLNYAYAVGGASVLEDTLADNYKLRIDHYAVVDFETMADVIDCVGGVELTISDEEADMINGYLYSMDASEYDLSGGGTLVLNGYQAVAHMRNRFVGDNDYERTQRQRDVLSAIFKKASSLSAEELAKLSAVMLSEVGHDYNLFEMAAMVARLPKLAGYELVENRVPYDGLYTSQDEMLVPDFEATCEKLHEVIGE